MQYGLSHLKYKKIRGEIRGTLDGILSSKFLMLTAIFFSALFVSRVEILKEIYPFGLALMISIINKLDSEQRFFVATGVAAGYILSFINLELLPGYLISVLTIFILCYIKNKVNIEEKKMKIMALITVGIIIFINFALVRNVYIALVTSLLVFILCGASLFIFESVINKLTREKKDYSLSNEQIISLCLLVSVIIAGTSGIGIFGVSLTNVFAILSIIIIGYLGGAANGAIFGVILGVLVGLSVNSLGVFVVVYASIGIISGIFKDMGKYVSIISVAIVYGILLFNYKSFGFKGIELVIAGGIFVVIPNVRYSMLREYFKFDKDCNKEEEQVNSKIKGVYKKKLNEFSSLLGNISDILTDLNENEKLIMKNKSTAMVQKLADRVCSECQLKSNCWRREMHYTYSAFVEVLKNAELNNQELPYQLNKKCINRTKLIENAEDIVDRNMISELKKSTISEGRQVLSNQIRNIAESVDEIIDEFDVSIKIDSNLEEKIRLAMLANNIKFKDVTCLKDLNGRISIKLKGRACGGEQNCVKNILPVINELSEKRFCVSNDGCIIDQVMKSCDITFEEMPKYHVSSYSIQKCKDGEKENGDSYRFIRNKKDKFISIVSDGMGSGPEAKRESEATVKLIEKFSKAGLSEMVAINAVNSVMAMKYKTQEKFSTLDIASLDLYNGNVEFFKVGSNESFIRRRTGDVDVIDSKSLPIGVLDKIDVDVKKKKIMDGDIIVMVSDGVLEYGDKSAESHWIMKYLYNCKLNNPKEIALGILNEALKAENYKVKDDMTISVLKVYNIN